VLCIAGRGATALFAAESGGHRWQRTPPNEKRGRVHTSTITVAVLPVPEHVATMLREEDLDESFTRGSGAGGQHRNKTDSCVVMVHRPTGASVRCESERADKRRTVRTQDDQVTDHVDGRTWRFKAYARGDW
jgi:peptide chain release factor 1